MYLSLIVFFGCVSQEPIPQAELTRDVASWIKRAGTEPPESLRDGIRNRGAVRRGREAIEESCCAWVSSTGGYQGANRTTPKGLR